MRILLALVVLVVAVVALIALLPSRSAPPSVEPVAVGPADPAPSAPLDPSPSETRMERADSAVVEAARDADPSVASTTCRVEIVLVGTEGGWSTAPLECFDGFGTSVPVEPTNQTHFVIPEVSNATKWVVPAANAGELHVEVHPHELWFPAGASFVIAPGETSKRVEIRMRRAPDLLVRWQSTDGRPIAVALRDPGVIDSKAILSLVFGVEPLGAGEPRPAASRPFTQIVASDSASDENSAGPLWEGAPADAFALLTLPVDPPCAIHACIGGIVVGSASILPDTREVVFRTNLDDVRGFRTTVRFCVVASETGEAFGGVGLSATSEWGMTLERIYLGPDGCRVETRLPPGEWSLLLDHPGRAPHAHDIALAPGADLDLGKIALAPDCPLRVRVLHPEGILESDLMALLQPLAGPRPSQSMSGAAANKGVFFFRNVPDEPLVLVLLQNPEWLAAPLLVEPCDAKAAREEMTLQLEKGTPIVLDFGPTSPLAPPVLVTDANGLPVARREIGLTGMVRLTLVPGEYRIARPGIPGAHAFTVRHESVVIEIR